ncbi:methyltransferase [Nocardia brasiliensis]|uniref:O-methyltransferase n=1 Tax=Nocardia brasiliensis (strain ATCC 700358 / HUJEG-1) TaxID=1133849 RepID=K0ET82_NOCB7|nr:methyltransferase [Nocardia brasiliensis]AFU00085.1 O-methyltransferase [Nocardia brasiliensis ATCC 700358]OCF86276.1 hypothetical protein AW168_31380 [Nocardia brasiliensis]
MTDPTEILRIATGFWASNTLAAALDVDLFAVLDVDHGLRAHDIAAKLQTAERPTGQLLAACTALGLIVRHADGTYELTPTTRACLLPDQPGYLGGFIRFIHSQEYQSWYRLPEVLRTDQPVTWDTEGGHASAFDVDDPRLSEFWSAIHSAGLATGTALAHTVRALTNRQRLLDVGGATGSHVIALCREIPHLRCTVYDLPTIAARTPVWITEADLSDRITSVAGDFLTDPDLPAGHDAILLSSVLHDWGPDVVDMLLGKAAAALPPGGLIIITELMLADDKSGPADAALMGLNMVIETEHGRSYSTAEHTAALARAGFTGIELVPLDLPTVNNALIATLPHR